MLPSLQTFTLLLIGAITIIYINHESAQQIISSQSQTKNDLASLQNNNEGASFSDSVKLLKTAKSDGNFKTEKSQSESSSESFRPKSFRANKRPISEPHNPPPPTLEKQAIKFNEKGETVFTYTDPFTGKVGKEFNFNDTSTIFERLNEAELSKFDDEQQEFPQLVSAISDNHWMEFCHNIPAFFKFEGGLRIM